MAPTVKLYMFAGSGPSLTARLMLEHKRIEHQSVHVLVGPHAFAMLARGFDTMTVPALRIGDRRVQGTREISRALDEIAPEPPLFDADPRRRDEIADAERWGEDLQDAARRITLAAARQDPAVFWSIYRHAKPRMRPVQRAGRRLTTRLASAGHRATDFVTQDDLSLLPERLDRIDAWIAEGLLNSSQLNAADFQIAPSVALLLRFEDLVAEIENRPAAQLAERVAPGPRGDVGRVLPAEWLAPLQVPAV
jgi:glutathione S-transferase